MVSTKTEQVDLVVVGAGWNGLCAAKTYHQVNPKASIIIVDDQPTIGGVWARHRLYPGLKTNNMRGNYEYGDFTFDDAGLDVQMGQHILGDEVYEYLKRYAEHFDIYRHIRFETRINTAEHLEGRGWALTASSSKVDGEKEYHIQTGKLIVATGLTSDAFVPSISGMDSFSSPIVHVKDFQARSVELFNNAKRATVLGGTKSAWDATYAFASAGVPVDWVIRKSGHGPVWMSPSTFDKKRGILLERLVHTRLITLFSPCVWGSSDGFGWIRSALHNTHLGRWVVGHYWRYMQSRLVRTNGYDEHDEVQKLKPWVDMFWIAGSLSILNYKTDFFDLVRKGLVRVHIADIEQLEGKDIHLSDGTVLESDALICSTGWRHRPAINFLPEGIDATIGIPHSGGYSDGNATARADVDILRSLPALNRQPLLNKEYKPMEGHKPSEALTEPYRLYRFMVPPKLFHERSIAFAGIVQSISTVYIAQAQGVWITAYFGGHTPLSLTGVSSDEMDEKLERETLLHTQYGIWRCPGGYGSRFPDFVYDGVPYVDMLLKDLGLESRRKSNIIAELTEPYLTYDYASLVDEWRIHSAELE